jgi:hypothetical protein
MMNGIISPIFYVINTALILWALYLSFKRNKGFDLGSFLVALFFYPIYIVYYYATEPKGK